MCKKKKIQIAENAQDLFGIVLRCLCVWSLNCFLTVFVLFNFIVYFGISKLFWHQKMSILSYSISAHLCKTTILLFHFYVSFWDCNIITSFLPLLSQKPPTAAGIFLEQALRHQGEWVGGRRRRQWAKAPWKAQLPKGLSIGSVGILILCFKTIRRSGQASKVCSHACGGQ